MGTGNQHVWLGKPGQLVQAGFGGSLSHSAARSTSVKQTLGGLDKVQWGKRPGREWSVQVNPWEGDYYQGLHALLWGAYGPPPWSFITPHMAKSNLVPPRASMFEAGTWSGTGTVLGAFTGADGSRHPVSLAATAGNVYFGIDSIVVPGQPVTASCYATAGTRVYLHIRDAGGVVLTNINMTTTTAGQRAVLTATAPEGAATARLVVGASTHPGTVAGPCVTISDKVLPYSFGQGVDAVMVDNLDTSVLIPAQTGSLASYSYTVREIRK